MVQQAIQILDLQSYKKMKYVSIQRKPSAGGLRLMIYKVPSSPYNL